MKSLWPIRLALKFTLPISLILILQACSLRLEPLPRPSGVLLEAAQRQTLIQLLKQKSQEVFSAKLLSRTRITAGDRVSSVRHSLLFSAPDKFRLETLPLNSAYALQIFILNGQDTRLLEPSENKNTSGKADGSQLRKIFGVPFKEQELPYFILARLPQSLMQRLEFDPSNTIYFDAAQRKYFAVLGDFEYFITFDADSLLISSLEYRDVLSTRVKSVISFADSENTEHPAIYKNLFMRFPKQEVQVDLKLASVSLNSSIPARFFEINSADAQK